MKSKVKDHLSAVFGMIGSHYLSFIAGTMASAAIGVFLEELPAGKLHWPYGDISGLFFLLSSLLFMGISSELADIHELAVIMSPQILSAKEQHKIKLRLVSQSLVKLIFLMFLAILSAGMGLLILGLNR